MKVALCRTCLAYQAGGDESRPGCGTCNISENEVNESDPACIDYRYYKYWRP